MCSGDSLDQESVSFLEENNINVQYEKNEGFDFGAWYKGFQKIDTNDFDHVFLVNDSCVLFRSLDPFMAWASKDNADVKGMTYSEAITPHIQSYFMILNKKAIVLAASYFKEHKLKADITEVIQTYELGLNKYFTNNGLKLSSFVDNDGYQGEFSPYYKCVDYHLQKGIPVIKTKILFSSYRNDELPNLARMGFNMDVDHYYQLMAKQKDLIIDPIELKKQFPPQMSSIDVLVFNLKRSLIKLIRPAYKVIKK
jgi:lipopolysaccharide biosynthesis protein